MPLLSLPLTTSVSVPWRQPPASRRPPTSPTLGGLGSASVTVIASIWNRPVTPSLFGQLPGPQRRRITTPVAPRPEQLAVMRDLDAPGQVAPRQCSKALPGVEPPSRQPVACHPRVPSKSVWIVKSLIHVPAGARNTQPPPC